MIENVRLHDMCGPVTFEFYAKHLNTEEAHNLCKEVAHRVRGVYQAKRTLFTGKNGVDTYTVTLDPGMHAKLESVYNRTIRVAYEIQVRVT